jgi:hypothetical protein
LLDVGTSHSTLPDTESNPQIVAALAELSMPNLPVYLISGCPNGAASDLSELVNFYNQRFQIGLTAEQKSDLVAFLSAL